MLTLETVVKKGNNNFDLIRLFLAFTVMFSHSFALFKLPGYTEPLHKLIGADNLGALAVYIFFFLSGIFITGSFLKSKDLKTFITHRICRIWPGLIVCTLLMVFLMGPLVANTTIRAYFFNKVTWSFFITNSTLCHLQFYLPGVFVNNRYSGTVNGSLWTLPSEVKCYFLVFIIGSILRYNKSKWMLVVVSLIIPLSFRYFLPVIIWKQCFFFLVGSTAYLLKKYFIIDKRLVFLLSVICCLFYKSHWFSIAFYFWLIYAVIVIGQSTFFRKIRLPGDYSYGTYIHAFWIQQTISYLLPKIDPYSGFLLTIPIVSILAILSWHFIEKPFLKISRSHTFNIKNIISVLKIKSA